MRIDYARPYVKEIDDLITDAGKKSLEAVAVSSYGSFTDLTIGQWIRCSQGDYSCILGELTGSWLQVYWLRYFADEAKRLPETLENLSAKMGADEQRACEALMKSSLVESVLVFVRNYFGLPSFRAVEDLTIGELLIAKKAAYNEATYNKALSNIKMNKSKSK